MYKGTYLHYSFQFFKKTCIDSKGCCLISNLLKENKQVTLQASEVLERSKEAKNTLCRKTSFFRQLKQFSSVFGEANGRTLSSIGPIEPMEDNLTSIGKREGPWKLSYLPSALPGRRERSWATQIEKVSPPPPPPYPSG
jgi:hypothetical protein